MKKIQVRILFFTLSFLSFSFLFSRTAFACSPRGSDPWYSTKLSFDEATLPIGVKVVDTEQEYEDFAPYSLVNTSSEPFYVVSKLKEWEDKPNSELPDGYMPEYKLVSNEAYYWSTGQFGDREGWVQSVKGKDKVVPNSTVRITDKLYTLDGRSKQVYKDNRPETVEIPESQMLTIFGFYKGEPVEIIGEISYGLNDEYDPEAFKKGAEACSQWNDYLNNEPLWSKLMWKVLFMLPNILFLTVFCALVFVIYKGVLMLKKRLKL